MKVLIIHSGKHSSVSPFVRDQLFWLEKSSVKYKLFPIAANGLSGYLKAILRLRKFLKKNANEFNLIHAHYGLSGLVATFQTKLPVVITYHGSDIHQKKVYKFSRIAIARADHNIFVSHRLKELASNPKNSSVIPCGVDFDTFRTMNQKRMRENLGLLLNKKYILFSSNFDRAIKRPELAIKAVEQIENTELIELKGFSRKEVAKLINAVDVCLLTSENEGSPQFIKEAAACQQYIVTTDVGDIREILNDYSKVKYIKPNIRDIVHALNAVLKMDRLDNDTYEPLSHVYDNKQIIKKIINVYETVLKSDSRARI